MRISLAAMKIAIFIIPEPKNMKRKEKVCVKHLTQISIILKITPLRTLK